MTDTMTRMNPKGLPDAAALGYSQISILESSGRVAYVSGQVAWRADGAEVPESLAEQTAIAAANAQTALDALGATPEDIAILRCFVVGLSPEAMEEAYPPLMSFLNGAQPSLTGIGVAALAAPDLKIELEMTVRLPA
ncbi:RidA family protein [Celeribacter neptunius]|uniref:Enamine deaminase RidA, house cleaning of reactive enamine intermediates, YjgF/YER057c/UK114 family n=1 Tax=Celeribacter neptunius TaxID=588602 RepID=A0A1I3VJL0_9RHOB|nr:RidA family protein [Celeribacter neptunius]SFJ95173.1 Enamine deaminase RidA, house cleaning of reactive enamine intermediates, YjgF/YER057c/UK114 family [Celeribacter neptunius]